MQYRECYSVSDVVREVFDLIRLDRSHFGENYVSYYFRGENRNFLVPNEVPYCKDVFDFYR